MPNSIAFGKAPQRERSLLAANTWVPMDAQVPVWSPNVKGVAVLPFALPPPPLKIKMRLREEAWGVKTLV